MKKLNPFEIITNVYLTSTFVMIYIVTQYAFSLPLESKNANSEKPNNNQVKIQQSSTSSLI